MMLVSFSPQRWSFLFSFVFYRLFRFSFPSEGVGVCVVLEFSAVDSFSSVSKYGRLVVAEQRYLPPLVEAVF